MEKRQKLGKAPNPCKQFFGNLHYLLFSEVKYPSGALVWTGAPAPKTGYEVEKYEAGRYASARGCCQHRCRDFFVRGPFSPMKNAISHR